jgi:hypothetical protein
LLLGQKHHSKTSENYRKPFIKVEQAAKFIPMFRLVLTTSDVCDEKGREEGGRRALIGPQAGLE